VPPRNLEVRAALDTAPPTRQGRGCARHPGRCVSGAARGPGSLLTAPRPTMPCACGRAC